MIDNSLLTQTPAQSGPLATISPTPTITPIPTPTATVAFTFSSPGISPENAAQVALVGEFASIPARCVAISPDNLFLAAGMKDASVYVWELATGDILHIFKGHTKPVGAVVFSTDGRYLITGSEDSTVKIWDLEADAELATLTGHAEAVNSVAFSPDGRTFASGSMDGSLLIWQLGNNTPIMTLPVDGPITSTDFSHDGRLLAAGLETGSVKVWDAVAGTLLVSMQAHSGAVNSVSFAPNGHRMVTGSADTTVKLWDVDTGKVLYTVGSHTEAVLVVAFSPDGRLVASASSGQAIKLWDVAGRREIALIRHARDMLGLAFSIDGRILVAALSPTNPDSNEGGVALWGVMRAAGNKDELEPLPIQSMQKELWIPGARMAVPHAAHQSVPILGDRLLIISGGEGNDPAVYTYKVELYNPASGASLLTGGLDTSRGLFSATLLMDGRVLVVGGHNPSDPWIAGAEIYDPLSAAWSMSQPLFNHGIGHTATLLNDGRVLVTGGCSGDGAPGRISQAELFDPTSNSWSGAGLMSQSRCGHFAALLANGQVLVAGGENGESILGSSELYDPVSNQWSQSGALNVARSGAVAVTLSDGRVMATGGRINRIGSESTIDSVEIYDINSGIWNQVMPMPEARYAHTANLLPGGEVLVVGGLEDLENGLKRFLGSVDIYDPDDDSWSQMASTASPRAYHTTTLLPDGRIFVAGGMSAEGIILASTEILVVSKPPKYAIPTPGEWPTSIPSLTLTSTITATITGPTPAETTPTLTPEGTSGGNSSILRPTLGSPDLMAGSGVWHGFAYSVWINPQKPSVFRDRA
jgi:WD40 repeat protein